MRLFPITQGILNYLNQQNESYQLTSEKIASQNELVRSSEKPSEKVRADIVEAELQSERAATKNAQDAKSMFQIAEGGLNEIHNLLLRMKELSLQGANEWIGYEERDILAQEMNQLKQEIDRIAATTRYKDQFLLAGEGKDYTFQVGTKRDEANQITFSTAALDARTGTLGVSDVDLSSADSSLDAIDSLNEALARIQTPRALTGSYQGRLESIERTSQNTEDVLSQQLGRMRDVDMAKAASELVKNRIMMEATIAILSQTSNLQRSTLRLLDF